MTSSYNEEKVTPIFLVNYLEKRTHEVSEGARMSGLVIRKQFWASAEGWRAQIVDSLSKRS